MRLHLVLLLIVTALSAQGQKTTNKWEDASTLVYPGAPACCVYVGLGTNDEGHFGYIVSRFALQNGFAPPQRGTGTNQLIPLSWYGPPLPDYKNQHVAIFWNEICMTGALARRHDSFHYATDQNTRAAQERAHDDLWQDAYWSTNASRISVDGQLVYARTTGRLVLAPFDRTYPLEDFKKLVQALTNALGVAFPGRPVYAPIYEGVKQ